MYRVIEVLTEAHVESRGGYPYDWTVFAGQVFIAELDPAKDYSKTMLTMHYVDDLKEWEKRAELFQKQHPSESWESCVYETAAE